VTGPELKQAGMQLAFDFAPVDWKRLARAAIEELARSGRPFTADDVIAIVGLPRPAEGSNRNNAVGAMISGAGRRRLIVKTGEYVTSRRPLSHARMIAVWVGR
jgi:hypothetical protein